jgi:thiol-disulfide isomerase/thioredoxin
VQDGPIPYQGTEPVRYQPFSSIGGSDSSTLKFAAALESGGSSMSKQHHAFLAVVTLLAPIVGVNRAHGDDIQWRESYTAAKKDSLETGRPMLMQFGSPACLWCQKLESSTLSSAEVAKIVNERFIPVKIDATVDVDLANGAGVHSFPTLFVVAPNRTILGRHEGFFEVSEALDFLNEGLANAPPPISIAKKTDDADKKSKRQAQAKLASRSNEAKASETEISPEKRARAQRLLSTAREDFYDGSFLASLDRCRVLQKEFAGQAEADEARKLMDKITADPERVRRASNDLGQNLVEIYRKLADEAAKAGHDSQAEEYRQQATRAAAALQSK